MQDHSEPTHELCIRISPLVHFTLSLASCSKLARRDLCDIVARSIASNHGGHSELNRSEIGGSRSLEHREGVAAWHEPSRRDVVVLLRRATSTLPCRARRCVVAFQRVVTPHLRRWISIKRAVVACRELSSQPYAAEQTSMHKRVGKQGLRISSTYLNLLTTKHYSCSSSCYLARHILTHVPCVGCAVKEATSCGWAVNKTTNLVSVDPESPAPKPDGVKKELDVAMGSVSE